MCSGLAVNKSINSWINLIFVGAFHPISVTLFYSNPEDLAKGESDCRVFNCFMSCCAEFKLNV